jgi:hypothetical protein
MVNPINHYLMKKRPGNRCLVVISQTFTILLLCSLSGFGQSDLPERNFMLSAGFGYNFSQGGGTLGIKSTNESSSGIYGSWAQGAIFNVDFSMRTCENLYTQFSWSYLNGRDITSSSLYDNMNSSYHQYNTNHLRIPMVLMVGSRYYVDPGCFSGLFTEDLIPSKMYPYLGIGGGLALGSKMSARNLTESVQNGTENTLEIRSLTRFQPAGVLYGELGLRYDYSDRLSFFAGFRGSSMSLINSKSKIRSYVENGVDRVDQMYTNELETEFFRELDLNETAFPAKPSKQLAQLHPCSGLDFSVGILYDILPAGKLPPINPGKLGGFNPPRGNANLPDPGRIKLTPDKEIQPEALNDFCKNCPTIKLKITSNNDQEKFPSEDIVVIRHGPWGGAALKKDVSLIDKRVLCNQCPGSGDVCCCRIDSVYVNLTFVIFINETKIDKGVWLNTNINDEENFGCTIKGKELPADLKNKEDWKLVDRKSVEVHERQHFEDLQVMFAEVIEKELKNFVVLQRPCTIAALEVCEERVDNYLNEIVKKLNKLVKDEAKDIAASENKNYSRSSELEKRARSIQAVDLNRRSR